MFIAASEKHQPVAAENRYLGRPAIYIDSSLTWIESPALA